MQTQQQVFQSKKNAALKAVNRLQSWLQQAEQLQQAQEQATRLLAQIEQSQRLIAELEVKKAQIEQMETPSLPLDEALERLQQCAAGMFGGAGIEASEGVAQPTPQAADDLREETLPVAFEPEDDTEGASSVDEPEPKAVSAEAPPATPEPVDDGVLPDGVLPDGVLPDGVLPDGVLPDGVLPDEDYSAALFEDPDKTEEDAGLTDLAQFFTLPEEDEAPIQEENADWMKTLNRLETSGDAPDVSMQDLEALFQDIKDAPDSPWADPWEEMMDVSAEETPSEQIDEPLPVFGDPAEAPKAKKKKRGLFSGFFS